MRIGLATNGKYNILDGNSDILCQCERLTDAACVLEYLTLTPMSALEKSIARQAVFNWDNKQRELQEKKKAKKARAKAKAKEKKTPAPETVTPEPAEEKETAPEEIEVPSLPEV